ncbi:PH domain-containing protein [Candidatus Woesebacteria bacterium]|nr:MAG: PH domain-containing protein [Candidatus Woesebacteria bacterium]
MNNIVTEKDYPVRVKWIFKSAIRASISLVFLGPFMYFSYYGQSLNTEYVIYIMLIVGMVVAQLFIAILKRATFHYLLDENYFTLHQGILSKQQRHVPYGVIQNVIIKQDLLDRILGLALLSVENASSGAGAMQIPQQKKFFGIFTDSRQQEKVETVGYSGNKISIPGLMKSDAEMLKELILQKMKNNSIEDSQSGL